MGRIDDIKRKDCESKKQPKEGKRERKQKRRQRKLAADLLFSFVCVLLLVLLFSASMIRIAPTHLHLSLASMHLLVL